MEEQVPRVVIGMDPHKRSVTIEVMLADESVVDGRRFDTTVEGYQEMLEFVGAWPDRVWAIEGCEGIGRHIALRLLGAEVFSLIRRSELTTDAYFDRHFDTGTEHESRASG